MAEYVRAVGDNETVKAWSKKLARESLKATMFSKFIADGDDEEGSSLVILKEDLTKGAGDRVRVSLAMQGNGVGKTEGETLEGSEEAAVTYTDDLNISILRHAFQSEDVMTPQRVNFDVRNLAKNTLRDWFADRLDTWFFNQLCGNTTTGLDIKYTGLNSALAPDSAHWIRGGAVSADESLGSGNTLKLQHIEVMVNMARKATPMIKPIRYKGGEYYVLFIHEDQATSLRTDYSTSGNWFDLQKARLQGGEGDDNGIFSGALGIYNNTVIHTSTRIPLGIHSGTGAAVSSTRRAVFCGAGALMCAFGKASPNGRMDWVEKMFDYDQYYGVAARMVGGMKKTRFNSADYGTITCTTYAASPAAA